MQRWRGVENTPSGWGRSVVTIGVFDGVHRGHQAIIGHAVKRAHDLGLQSVVITFDPHPSEVVRPGSHPAVLTEPVRKAELIERLGVDALCVVPFTPAFSQLSPEAFIHDVLVEALHSAVVVVGDNFRFGHRAAGDVSLLERLGRSFGFTVEEAPLVAEDGVVFSSTYIRSCVDAGDVRAAAADQPRRVHAVGRHRRVAMHHQVGGGKADLAAALVALHDLALDRPPIAELARSLAHMAVAQRIANGAR